MKIAFLYTDRQTERQTDRETHDPRIKSFSLLSHYQCSSTDSNKFYLSHCTLLGLTYYPSLVGSLPLIIPEVTGSNPTYGTLLAHIRKKTRELEAEVDIKTC